MQLLLFLCEISLVGTVPERFQNGSRNVPQSYAATTSSNCSGPPTPMEKQEDTAGGKTTSQGTQHFGRWMGALLLNLE